MYIYCIDVDDPPKALIRFPGKRSCETVRPDEDNGGERGERRSQQDEIQKESWARRQERQWATKYFSQ